MFTDEQLYEIEKRFDELAEASLRGLGSFIKRIDDTKNLSQEQKKKIVSNVVEEHTNHYDLVRTISAVARKERTDPIEETILFKSEVEEAIKNLNDMRSNYNAVDDALECLEEELKLCVKK